MDTFSKTSTIAHRVNTIIKADIERRSKGWLIGLGYQDCNDYAQTVVNRASFCINGFEHVRFETVARYIRSHKKAIRAELAAQPSLF